MRKVITFLFYLFFHFKEWEIFMRLKKTQSASIDKIRQKQFEQIKHLLLFSYKNIPYYRELFIKVGLVENGELVFNKIEDLERIPPLTKDIIRKKKDELIFYDHKKRGSYKNTSGGSTGEPVVLIQDKNYSNYSEANFLLVKTWRQISPFSDTTFLWGASRDLNMGSKIKRKISYFFHNVVMFNSSTLTIRDIKNFIAFINKKKPKLIIAYAQSIYEVAKYAKENNITIKKQNAIHTGAGMLYDYMRKIIEEVFQCKVYNHYGSREVSSIASECKEHNGLHVLSELNYVEIVDESGKHCKYGEEGEVLVTNLQNFSMPLIRYKIGDLGVLRRHEKCSCGCNYQKIDKITGRTNQNFKNSKGEIVSGEYLTLLFNFVPGIEKFQIIQVSLKMINVKLVVTKDYNKKHEEIIKTKMTNLFGHELVLSFEYLKEIPSTATGKYLYTINQLAD